MLIVRSTNRTVNAPQSTSLHQDLAVFDEGGWAPVALELRQPTIEN